MSGRWFGDDDPYQVIGKVRLIILKHNDFNQSFGDGKSSVTKIHSSAFEYSFLCPDIQPSNWRSGPVRDWIRSNIKENVIDSQLEHITKNLTNGFYELIGDMWLWSSKSYEGEYDNHYELRDFKTRAICFDHAVDFDDDDVIAEETVPTHDAKININYAYAVHWSMPVERILRNYANILGRMISSHYSTGQSGLQDMTVDQLKDYIHMLRLQIDSSSNEERTSKLAQMENDMDHVLRMHDEIMISETNN